MILNHSFIISTCYGSLINVDSFVSKMSILSQTLFSFKLTVSGNRNFIFL